MIKVDNLQFLKYMKREYYLKICIFVYININFLNINVNYFQKIISNEN